jgi:hypothetical protein
VSSGRWRSTGGAPLSVDTGTSTAGVRIPPITFPKRSRATIGGFSLLRRKGGGDGGRVAWTSHFENAAKAAWTTLCCAPVLTGVV